MREIAVGALGEKIPIMGTMNTGRGHKSRQPVNQRSSKGQPNVGNTQSCKHSRPRRWKPTTGKLSPGLPGETGCVLPLSFILSRERGLFLGQSFITWFAIYLGTLLLIVDVVVNVGLGSVGSLSSRKIREYI